MIKIPTDKPFKIPGVVKQLVIAVAILVFYGNCRSTPDHHVFCTQAKMRRAEAGKGTPNDRQVRCHGLTQARLAAAPGRDFSKYADCVLEAENNITAGKCE